MLDDSDMCSVDLCSLSGSTPSLSCYSVDERVLGILWDDNVKMDDLLSFSFDRIDKLAAKQGTTVKTVEKNRLWDYVQRMKEEQYEWDAQQPEMEEALKALSDMSLTGHGSTWCIDGIGTAEQRTPERRRASRTNENFSWSFLPKKKSKLWKKLFPRKLKGKTAVSEKGLALGAQNSSSASCVMNRTVSPGSGRLRSNRLNMRGFLRRSVRRLQIGSLSRLARL
ncbi:uncharacterized protein LOC135400982 isoform X2 [Ornithodoros turicata]|uniref:uncharacterized protein LOC135400982 isoform X2 n=1 Tax=Ornithodoros turicata TaxID=34597 RepID=UPI00313A0AC5